MSTIKVTFREWIESFPYSEYQKKLEELSNKLCLKHHQLLSRKNGYTKFTQLEKTIIEDMSKCKLDFETDYNNKQRESLKAENKSEAI